MTVEAASRSAVFTCRTVRRHRKLSLSKAHQFLGNGINPYIWCVVGAVFGGLACLVTQTRDKAVIFENLGVGIFGAFIGAEFLINLLPGGAPAANEFTLRGFGLALGGAFVGLLALRLMRRTVGPMRASKAPRRRDY